MYPMSFISLFTDLCNASWLLVIICHYRVLLWKLFIVYNVLLFHYENTNVSQNHKAEWNALYYCIFSY